MANPDDKGQAEPNRTLKLEKDNQGKRTLEVVGFLRLFRALSGVVRIDLATPFLFSKTSAGEIVYQPHPLPVDTFGFREGLLLLVVNAHPRQIAIVPPLRRSATL